MSMKLAITTATVLAVLAGPALADQNVHPKAHAGRHAHNTTAQANAIAAGAYGNARAAIGPSYDFDGYPTDYLVNRFGDRQLQGR